jgi:phage terminase Nu1 subunit (DNA packaging protein)
MTQVNRAGLADILGYSLPTITSKVQRGMPYLQKGQHGKMCMFDTVEITKLRDLQAINNACGDTDLQNVDELILRS